MRDLAVAIILRETGAVPLSWAWEGLRAPEDAPTRCPDCQWSKPSTTTGQWSKPQLMRRCPVHASVGQGYAPPAATVTVAALNRVAAAERRAERQARQERKEALARRLLADGATITEAARRAGIAAKTARKVKAAL